MDIGKLLCNFFYTAFFLIKNEVYFPELNHSKFNFLEEIEYLCPRGHLFGPGNMSDIFGPRNMSTWTYISDIFSGPNWFCSTHLCLTKKCWTLMSGHLQWIYLVREICPDIFSGPNICSTHLCLTKKCWTFLDQIHSNFEGYCV